MDYVKAIVNARRAFTRSVTKSVINRRRDESKTIWPEYRRSIQFIFFFNDAFCGTFYSAAN